MRSKVVRTGAEQVATLAVVVLTLPVVAVGLLAAAGLAVLEGDAGSHDLQGAEPRASAHLDEDVALTEGRRAVAVLR